MYRQPYIDEPRLTVSSVLLLAVFVGAVAVVVAAFFWQPWDDDAPGQASSGPAVEAPAGDDASEEASIVIEPAE